MRKRVDERPVAGFNLVAVIGGEGLCLHYDGELRPQKMAPGAHVISTNRDLNDSDMPEKRIFDRMFGDPTEERLKEYLASHEGERPVCKHGEKFGTVSSALYMESKNPRFLFADGPPCRTEFQPCDF